MAFVLVSILTVESAISRYRAIDMERVLFVCFSVSLIL
jgi:hypothetical protein